MSNYIEKIYSKIKPDLLLHQVIRNTAFQDAKFRINACEDKEWLQIAILNLKKEQTFKPHKHILRKINKEMIPQECWVVINGKVQVFYWDINDKPIFSTVLNPGEITITFYGGHTYKSLLDNTLVYEIKTPFYEGVEKDKVFI